MYESPPGRERRPWGAGANHESHDLDTSSIPPSVDSLPSNGPVSLDKLTSPCHTDEFGLLDIRCLRQLLEAEERAYVRGYAAGRESVYAEIHEDVAQVARNAAYSIDVMRARERAKARWSA